jgi:hypothetical protein
MDIYIPLAAILSVISFYTINRKYFPLIEAALILGGFIVACFVPYIMDQKHQLGEFKNDIYLQLLYACVAVGVMAVISKFMLRWSSRETLSHKIVFGCYIAGILALGAMLPWKSMLQ